VFGICDTFISSARVNFGNHACATRTIAFTIR
jgi:hypothetical protein